MHTMIRTGWIASILFFAHIDTVKASEMAATTYKVTTFNIEWYGLGGSPDNGSEDEYRDANLKKYIAQRLVDTDVLVVEEIIDLDRLEANVLARGWTCKTYFSRNDRHQHVGMCVRPGLQFISESSDDNDIIDQVASDLERSRPALHLIVANERKQPLFRVIGVHLKAAPDFSAVRVEQAKQIASYIQNLRSNLPIIMTGDFNTFNKSDTRQNLNDDELMSRVWKPLGLSQAVGNYFTYKTPKYSSHFDRFWVSSNVKTLGSPSSQPECQYRQSKPEDLEKIKAYNRDISDHCPVTLSFSL